MAAEIDYGLGQTNIDQATGIRYGVIPFNDLHEWAYEDFQPEYGTPSCPDCGREVSDSCYGKDYFCDHCFDVNDYRDHESEEEDREDHKEYCFRADECYPESPLYFYVDDGRYTATQGQDDCDVFITKSPYFTYAEFCSPCAPGAGYLRNSNPDGIKTYCFGPEWFEGEKAPYPVYSVETEELVNG